MRILHTADWHLGASIEGVSLIEEQRRFLEWLLKLIAERQIDALVVSGDVFDLAHPPAEAQSLYYQFLARLASLKPPCAAVITAGNHDSAKRLEAPRELLDALSIRVVGALPTEANYKALLVPLRSAGGEVAAVVAAVPYVHEYRLGISPAGRSAEELAVDMRTAFGSLYGRLASMIGDRWPDVPAVAMGHLTVGSGVCADDFNQPIHQVGTIDALPATIFGAGWSYVALGHVHRAYPAGGSSVWYSGTPVAVSMTEGATPRYVRVVEFQRNALQEEDGWEGTPGGAMRQESIAVPCWRTLLAVSGTESEVLAEIRSAKWEGDLEPLLRAEILVESRDVGLEERLRNAVAALPEPRPRIVAVHQRRIAPANAPTDATPPELHQLSPDEVFAALHRARLGGEPTEELMMAFRELQGLEVAE
jgi:DNA repair protein SbcD/Mre11